MKKMLLILIFSMFFVGSVFAGWYTCTINEIGINGVHYYINLTDNASAFTERWFTISETSKKEILATALTAQINNKSVKVLIDSTQASPPAYSIIPSIYLKK